MARAKLTDPEKQEILRLFRESDITATKLAEQFSVSISTISRLLKTELSDIEYTTLSANRRKSGTASVTATESAESGTLDLFENVSVEQVAEMIEVPEAVVPEIEIPIAVEEISVVVEELPVAVEEVSLVSPVEIVGDVDETPAIVVEAVIPVETESEAVGEEAPVAAEGLPTLTEEVLAPIHGVVEEEVATPTNIEDFPGTTQEASVSQTNGVVILEPLEIPIPRRRRRSAGAVPETPVVVEETVVETPAAVETPVVAETAAVVEVPAVPTGNEAIFEVEVEEPPVVIEETPTPEQPVRSRILKKSERVASPPPSESNERLAAPLAELEAEFAASPGQFAADDFDDDEDFDDVEEDDGSGLEPELATVESALPVEVLPFSSAEFPRTCWVMVDRASELLTRPLGDFSNIGVIPDTEREAVTLPIFENHRLARRYSSNYHRPLRLPVHLLNSTRPYLLRKGITRLLVGTQVYALDLAEDGIEEEETVESGYE